MVFQMTQRSPPMMSNAFLCMVLSFMLRHLGSMHASLKSSRARMRRSLLETSGAKGRSCLRVTVLVAVPVPVGVFQIEWLHKWSGNGGTQ